jgi:hypothetical protein
MKNGWQSPPVFHFHDACGRIARMTVNWNFELTNVALFIGAIIAAIYARRQVGAMRESNQKQAESAKNQELQLRANVLLALDQRWETEPLVSVRVDLQDFIKKVFDECATRWPGKSASELRPLTAPIFLSRLNELETQDAAMHFRLFQICGFFETVGYVARAGYVTPDDIFYLLAGSIMSVATVFTPYVNAKLQAGNDARYYENFLWIVTQVERKQAIS